MSNRAMRSEEWYRAEARAERRECRRRDEARFLPPTRGRPRREESPDEGDAETTPEDTEET